MTDSKALAGLGELTRPATVLIERIADALGGYFKPYQIRRVAGAEADAERIRALAQIEISDLQRRALQRFVAEESRKQDNIEAITSKALPQLDAEAQADKLEDDWIANFFDKCRLISDDDMQTLWARVLAGEANSPGRYTKRTVNFLGSVDKEDARLFAGLCGFGCFLGNVIPVIDDLEAEVYRAQGLSFGSLKHLDDIGLIGFDPLAGFQRIRLPKRARLFYYGTAVDLEFASDKDNSLALGHVLLTRIGQELAPICGSKEVPGFLDYLLGKWMALGIISSTPYPRVGLTTAQSTA